MPSQSEPIKEDLIDAQIQQEIERLITFKNQRKRPASKDLEGENRRSRTMEPSQEEMEISTPCPPRENPTEPLRPTHTRTRSNFSPFIRTIPRYLIVGKTLKATSVEEALEIARNLVIQAANLAENNPTQQTSLLDLVEVFRDYTKTSRVNKKNSAILGD